MNSIKPIYFFSVCLVEINSSIAKAIDETNLNVWNKINIIYYRFTPIFLKFLRPLENPCTSTDVCVNIKMHPKYSNISTVATAKPRRHLLFIVCRVLWQAAQMQMSGIWIYKIWILCSKTWHSYIGQNELSHKNYITWGLGQITT